MKLKRLHFIFFSFICIGAIATLCLINHWNYAMTKSQILNQKYLVYSATEEDENTLVLSQVSAKQDILKTHRESCRMATCFDFTKCLGNQLKVYVYPFENGERVSLNYAKIIQAVKRSVYYTADPSEACLFVVSIDTTDQDPRSNDYVKHVGDKISGLPYWNDGRNHVLFNLYSGTWPSYVERLDFDTGHAILAKASFSQNYFRPGFDISLPLFDKELPNFGNGNVFGSDKLFPFVKKYKIVFKGKRYLHGIGGESRASLHHIHNNKDILMLTTCKHGRNWKDVKDDRCDHDNMLYDRYDYQELMNNATFCLIPRGRRLGSYRFLEAMQSGCIPLILSNGWVLPFHEKIDWKKAVIFADERLLTMIPTLIRDFSDDVIFKMKQQALFLWNTYLSSVDKIVQTVFQVINSRIIQHTTNEYVVWNTLPGSLSILQSYSKTIQDFPFYYAITGQNVSAKFSAVIYAWSSYLNYNSPLYMMIEKVAKSQHVSKIIVLWTAKERIPEKRKWPLVGVTIIVQRINVKRGDSRMSVRFVTTDAILSLDEDVNLKIDEINFAFRVWQKFPDRIVGFPCRTHYWDRAQSKWIYSSQWANECSMVLTSAAFYHRYYNFYYSRNIASSIHELLNENEVCQDMILTFVVAHITRQPPIKVLEQKPYKEEYISLYKTESAKKQHFEKHEVRKECFQAFVDAFGYMPLIYTSASFDPVLYKDPISNFRKRYRLLE